MIVVARAVVEGVAEYGYDEGAFLGLARVSGCPEAPDGLLPPEMIAKLEAGCRVRITYEILESPDGGATSQVPEGTGQAAV